MTAPPIDGRSVSPAEVVDFFGLGEEATLDDEGRYAFGLGVLYPYTPWLGRVLECFEATAEAHPEAAPVLLGEAPGAPLDDEARVAVEVYLVIVDDLHRRVAFAPGGVGERMRDAVRRVRRASAPTREERRRR